jgi:hypothetical protein
MNRIFLVVAIIGTVGFVLLQYAHGILSDDGFCFKGVDKNKTQEEQEDFAKSMYKIDKKYGAADSVLLGLIKGLAKDNRELANKICQESIDHGDIPY